MRWNFVGWRKWTMGVLGLLLAFLAAMFSKLTPELATVIGTIVSGFFASNGFTTGKGREPQPGTASQQS